MSEKTAVRLQLNLSDPKTRKPSNYHEWKRRLLGDALNVLWLNSDYNLLEDSTLPATHTLIKKLKYIVSLLANPLVKANPIQQLKLQTSLDDSFACPELVDEDATDDSDDDSTDCPQLIDDATDSDSDDVSPR